MGGSECHSRRDEARRNGATCASRSVVRRVTNLSQHAEAAKRYRSAVDGRTLTTVCVGEVGGNDDVSARVLLVEDDESVRRSTGLLLERAGLDIEGASTGEDALVDIAREHFDLVLLDIMLPGIGGFEVCRRIRRFSQVPIVFLTARADVSDVVAGLELGADDYVVKPFEGAELLARVRAVLRRNEKEPTAPTIQVGEIVVDRAGFSATKHGARLDLSATEFRLLVELTNHAGQVLTREMLLERVWGYDYLGDSRLVDMAVKRLRDKLEDDSRKPTYITTVRGVGYRFERPQE